MDIQYRHALAEIAAARGGSEGLIRIGAGPVWYSCFLPPILDRFASLHPHVRFSLRAGVIDTLIPGLIGGEIDIVCASLDFPNRAEIAREPIIDLRHVVVAADSHPLAGRDDVAPEELARFPWVTLGGDHVGTGRIWSYFAAHGCPPPRIAVESSSQSAILELVAGGRFLAHMPEVMARQAARHGVRPLVTPGVFWETPAGIAYRQSEHQLPMLRRFIEAVRAIGRRG
ncbi:MAG: hypothetical protein D6686_16015 [Alphaproteobacteria bacterium]|nr:MAG: hypothetical protein D6686_16015 [Alphaproteobacteria bacterium]